MKKISLFLFVVITNLHATAQNVGIGTTSPNANAALEIKSSTKGILMPRTSTATKNAMPSVAKGMLVYDTTQSSFYYHDGNKWRPIGDKNPDSLLNDFSASPQVTANMTTTTFTTAQSGILYDNGGPAGNYAPNSSNIYIVDRDGATATDSIAGYKVVIQEMNLESPYDSLEIYSDSRYKTVISGTTTGTYYFTAGNDLRFRFRSNAVNNFAGFKIIWTVLTVNTATTEAPPLYGWYFNAKKMAARGGLPNGNDWSTDSLGKFSLAYGYNSRASGYQSVAFGGGDAKGDYSFSMGPVGFASLNSAEGFASMSMGVGNHVTGDYARGFGITNIVSGYQATGIGGYNSVTGNSAVALGSQSFATEDNATAIGYYVSAGGGSSLATGYQTYASGLVSTAMGNYTTASGTNSFATGLATTARGFASTVVGMYNSPILSTAQTAVTSGTPLFIVGNGDGYGDLHNAMMVRKDGHVGIGTNTPFVQLHIDGGGDASMANSSGYVVVGDINGLNMVVDDNEIIARNNGVISTLYLQKGNGALETGGAASKPGGGSWSATSDARLKQNVTAYTDGLQQVLKINPVHFQYNAASGYDTKQQYIGVIAQELKEIAPYMVGTFSKDKTEYLNVDNSAMTYMLINAVKELNKQNEELKVRLEKLEAAILK